MPDPRYFDHNATTPLDPRVLEAMLPYLQRHHGNPSSLHRSGRISRDAVEAARAQVAALVAGPEHGLIFTSGGTEADNLALRGGMLGEGDDPFAGRVLYGASEHPAILESAESLALHGADAEPITLLRSGTPDWSALEAQLARAPTRLIALMALNNETGVLHDLPRAAALAHAAGAALMVDAVQAAGRIPLDFGSSGADFMSLSSHKIYGPKGVGALLVASGCALARQMHGGGQERGQRGGTENVAGIVGFGAAAELAVQEREVRMHHAQALRERFEAGLARLPGALLFGAEGPRGPYASQFALPGWHGEALLMELDRRGFAVSSGSACASGSGEPSHVLLAMGYPREIAFGAVRVSYGQANTAEAVDALLAALRELAQRQPG